MARSAPCHFLSVGHTPGPPSPPYTSLMTGDRLIRPLLLGVLLAALTGWSLPATAQVYNTQVYGPSDGLNSSVVFGAAQDSTGRLWFATRRGLVRYDGKDWYNVPDRAPGFERGARDVCIDDGGRLWSTTALGDVQVACRDLDGSVRFSLPPVGGAMLARGTLFLTVAADGTAPDRVLLANLNGTVSYWNGERWRTWGPDEPDLAPPLPTAAVVADSCFLLATQSGLWRLPFTGEPSYLDLPGLPAGPVYGICRAGNGGFWLAARSWLGRLRDDRVTLLAEDLDLDLGPLKYEIAAAEGPSGGLYFGGYTTAYHFHPKRGLETLGRASGLIGGGTTDILVDRENLVWICSARGVSKLIDRSVASMDRRHGLFEDEVSAVYELSPGRMILGHNGGLTVLGDETVRIPLPTGQRHARVMDIHVTEQGQIWLACDVGGLFLWSEQDGFRWYGAASGVPGTIYTVNSDQAGTLWVGSNRGLFRRDGETFRSVPLFPDTLDKTDYVRRLVIARDGTLLAATGNNGLLLGDEGGFTRYAHPDNELLNSGYAAFEDADGRVFVGNQRRSVPRRRRPVGAIGGAGPGDQRARLRHSGGCPRQPVVRHRPRCHALDRRQSLLVDPAPRSAGQRGESGRSVRRQPRRRLGRHRRRCHLLRPFLPAAAPQSPEAGDLGHRSRRHHPALRHRLRSRRRGPRRRHPLRRSLLRRRRAPHVPHEAGGPGRCLATADAVAAAPSPLSQCAAGRLPVPAAGPYAATASPARSFGRPC